MQMPTATSLQSKRPRRARPGASTRGVTSGGIERPVKSVRRVRDLDEVFASSATTRARAHRLAARAG